jgi:hypothetical protein
MGLIQTDLTAMLANAGQPAAEQVMAIKPSRSSLRFRKDEWGQLFPGWHGIRLKAGSAVQIVRAKRGGPKADMADDVRRRLELGKGDTLCVTVRGGELLDALLPRTRSRRCA